MLGEGREGSRGDRESRAEERPGTNRGTENRHIKVVWANDFHLRGGLRRLIEYFQPTTGSSDAHIQAH